MSAKSKRTGKRDLRTVAKAAQFASGTLTKDKREMKSKRT